MSTGADWVSFIHRGRDGVPLLIAAVWREQLVILDRGDDDALGGYSAYYEVFIGEERALDDMAWASLYDRGRLRRVGTIEVAAVRIDQEARRLDTSYFGDWREPRPRAIAPAPRVSATRRRAPMHAVLVQFLGRRENRLEQVVSDVLGALDGQPCRHVDRHVLGVIEAVMNLGSVRVRRDAVRAAIELACRWRDERLAIAATVSSPVVMVEDEWIRGELDAPPPHVYICVAARPEDCAPASYGLGATAALSAIPEMIRADRRVRRKQVRVRRCAEGDRGVWYILPCPLRPYPSASAQ